MHCSSLKSSRKLLMVLVVVLLGVSRRLKVAEEVRLILVVACAVGLPTEHTDKISAKSSFTFYGRQIGIYTSSPPTFFLFLLT